MKHLKKFNLIKESHSQENEIDVIIDSMRDFLDDDRNILFKSSINDTLSYQDYIDKNSKYIEFKPIINTGNVIRSSFSIHFQDIKDYSDFLLVTNEMQSVFGRLKDEDWTMYDMKIVTNPTQSYRLDVPPYRGDIRFKSLSFYFSKPDQELQEEFKWPDENHLIKAFNKYGLVNLTFYYSKENEPIELKIQFDSVSYDGRVPNSIEELFLIITNRFGFDHYEYNNGDFEVIFFNS
jgi:hypothetical protein